MGNLFKVGAMEYGLLVTLFLIILPQFSSAQLKQNFYADICPNAESIVRRVVYAKASKHFATIPGTVRLFFHDCFVEGCDASIMIYSQNGGVEKDHEDNISIAGDSYDVVIRAKAKLDRTPGCKNKVSCADILAMATRDVITFIGGPSYEVELGRLDGLSSTNTSVTGKLPHPTFNLDQLNSMFSANGLSQTDMIALSGAHTMGFSFCKQFTSRLYNFSSDNRVDPTINKTYVPSLKSQCPEVEDPLVAINMDPITPRKFDNMYYQNLKLGMGLFTSDQVLYTDSRSRATVKAWASNYTAFEEAFVIAMTKMGRIGVKTGSQGNVRRDCAVFN